MSEAYERLLKRLSDAHNLSNAGAVLSWDQQTNMPPGGSEARGAQLATLSRVHHELFASEETGKLLEDAAKELDGADPDSDPMRLIQVTQQDYDDLTRIPADHVAELTRVTSIAQHEWAKAREQGDFSLFQPHLEHIVDLTLKTAEYLGYTDNPYDALLYQFERDLKTADVKAIFDGHKQELIDLVDAIGEVSDRVDNSVLHQHFDVDGQRDFARMIIETLGFDFQRGRQDVAVHPFCTGFSRNDVRVTTRFDENFLNPALFGMMHEAGHGMYEQGLSEKHEGTPLGNATSLSVHESQSRMWENIVGRSRGFWHWALPKLKAQFPQLENVDLETFYKAINKVQRSFIRVEADEATYNLHIMLRFELENDLVNGRVKVTDLPKEWNARFEQFLGLTPPDDRMGVLQDVHWSGGMIGYFPTYALGNLLSVQYYNKAVQDHPSIPDEITEGKFDTLLTWLNTNIHQHGRKYNTNELTQRVTGSDVDSKPYINYLQEKYSDVYGL